MEVATEMSSSIYESKTAKKVYLYRNGVVNSDPKCLIVNQRQVRDFGSFLTRVTSGLKAPVAIRNIYTPAGGHKVKSLDSLESGRYYVAGGSEHFKKIKYGSSSPQKLLTRRPPRKELSVPSRLHQAVVAEARYKKPIEKPFVIHVFRNGDFRYRGARVLLPRRIMGSWEHVLEIVTEKADLFTPAKHLCTLDGHVVHAVSELQDGGKYVAIEGTKPFQRVAYCATDDRRSLMHTFPKAAIRLRGPRRRPLHQVLNDVPTDGAVSDPGKTPVPPLSQALRQRRLDKRKPRPMAGRKNKEAREKAIEDHRADSIFGGSPTRDLDTSIEGPVATSVKNGISPAPHPLSKSETLPLTKDAEIDMSTAATVERKPGVFHAAENSEHKEQKQTAEYIEDTQGESVFKAKAQRTDVADAEVVTESQDTEVERPIDLEEAEEVEEEREELGKEGVADVSNEVSPPEEPQPKAHTSIDLSVNIVQPTASATTQDLSDSNTLAPGQPSPPPPQPPQNDNPNVGTGSATSLKSHQSENSSGAGSKEADVQQSQVEGVKVSEEERNTIESTEARGEDVGNDDGGDSNPPPEEVIQEDIPETTEEHKPTDNEAEGAVEIKSSDPVEEVVEEVQEEPIPPTSTEPEPEPVEEIQEEAEVEEGDPAATAAADGGGTEEQPVTELQTEPVDTNVQEEIVEEVDTSALDDTGSSQKEDEPTTTFVVEDLQQQS